MAEFEEMRVPWTGVVATDSLSLLDTLFGRDETRRERERERDEPINLSGSKIVMDCLSPDWDILIEIQEALQKLPNIRLEHVKGHQDRDRRFADLPQMAQLNVDADAKAGAYQDAHGVTRPIVLMTPLTRAHLIGPQGTVTGHYAEYLREAATAPPLQEHLQTKYRWTERVLTMVHWDSHDKALQHQYKRRTQLTKLVHDILLTATLLNKFDNGQRRCPSCHANQEDRDHVLRCLSNSRVQWRIALWIAYRSFVAKHRQTRKSKHSCARVVNSDFLPVREIYKYKCHTSHRDYSG
jgi:hypothetical protein